jgi:hypothetical protein
MSESAQLTDFAALRRLKELADSGNEQAMILYADLACGRLSYIDFRFAFRLSNSSHSHLFYCFPPLFPQRK